MQTYPSRTISEPVQNVLASLQSGGNIVDQRQMPQQHRTAKQAKNGGARMNSKRNGCGKVEMKGGREPLPGDGVCILHPVSRAALPSPTSFSTQDSHETWCVKCFLLGGLGLPRLRGVGF